MADDKDVLDKADALLRRHGPAAPAGSATGEYPVLTDLVDPGAAAPQAPASPPASEDDAPALVREVVPRVIAEVERRLADDLERRLGQRLADQLQGAIGLAVAELRPELTRIVREALAEALRSRPVK